MSRDAKRFLLVIGVLDVSAAGLMGAAVATDSPVCAIAGVVLAVNALIYAYAKLVAYGLMR